MSEDALAAWTRKLAALPTVRVFEQGKEYICPILKVTRTQVVLADRARPNQEWIRLKRAGNGWYHAIGASLAFINRRDAQAAGLDELLQKAAG